MGTPTLPFGKHKGQPLSEIPVRYLSWLCTRPELFEKTRTLVEAELDRRRMTLAKRVDDAAVLVAPSATVGELHSAKVRILDGDITRTKHGLRVAIREDLGDTPPKGSAYWLGNKRCSCRAADAPRCVHELAGSLWSALNPEENIND